MFGAGTVQWAWGLDNVNAWSVAGPIPNGNPPDPNMQQATVNLLADMGAQPDDADGRPGRRPRSRPTRPRRRRRSRRRPATRPFQDGNQVTITGTATDTGGGVVAGVEVSTDGGTTWHPADDPRAPMQRPSPGPTPGSRTATHRRRSSRGRPTTAATSRRRRTDRGQRQLPVLDVGHIATPTVADCGDATGVEVGVKFQVDRSMGTITGVRFYKATTNTGTHVGSLWTASGQLLGQATFTSETASGWQSVSFCPARHDHAQHHLRRGVPRAQRPLRGDDEYFYPAPGPTQAGGADYLSPPLSAVNNNVSPNGVFAYGSTSTFPTNTFGAANYWVDPVFMPVPAPGQVTGVTGVAGFDSVTLSWNAPSSGGAPASYTVTPFIGSTAQTPVTVTGAPPVTTTTITGLQQGPATRSPSRRRTRPDRDRRRPPSNAVTPTGPVAPGAPTGVTAIPATGQAQVSWTAPATTAARSAGYTITPYLGATRRRRSRSTTASATSATVTGLTNGTAYTFTVTATNGAGHRRRSPPPSAAVTPEDTIFDFRHRRQKIDSGDPGSGELGVKFTADTSGSITGIRFYKAAANTGTHIGSLWTATGTLLASATFTNETASGWQTVLFSTPVAITAGTTYVASYLAPNGHYSATQQRPRQLAVDNPPLHAVANSTSANGVYAYSDHQHVPDQHLQGHQLLGRRPLRRRQRPPRARSTDVTATAGGQSATVTWTRPAAAASRPATRSRRTSARPPRRRRPSPAPRRHERHHHRPDAGNHLHVHGPGVERARLRPGVGGVELGHPDRRRARPSAPHERDREPGVQPGVGQLVRAGQQRRQRHHRLHDHALTSGSTAQTPVQVNSGSATSAIVTGLTNGTAYTFTVTATNGDRHRPGVVGVRARSRPQDTIFDFSGTAVRRSTPATRLRSSSGVKFTADVQRIDHRHPLLQGGRQHRHPHRQPVDRERHPAGLRHVHQRDRLRLADGRFLDPGRDHRRHHLRRQLLRPQRPLLRHQRRRSPTRGRQPAAARASPTAPAPTASTPTAPTQHLPDQHLQANNYWVDVLFAAARRARARRPACPPPPLASDRDRDLDRAVERRGTDATRSPRTSARPRRRRPRSPARRRRPAPRSPA